jgi:glycosyltransferase involved in cell wall biosynthesis
LSLPKVLVFTVTYEGKDYCLNDFIENIQKFTYKNFEHIFVDNTNDNGEYTAKLKAKLEPLGVTVYHVERGANSREALARSQNFARDIFLKGDYDYLMSLESDIFPRPNVIDTLVFHGFNVITGLYMLGFEKDGTRMPCITLDWKNPATGTVGTQLLALDQFLDYMDKGVKEVAAGGMGCCLMYRSIVEKVPFTFIPGHKGHSDVFWFNDARKLGEMIAVDTSLFCEHKNSSWDEVSDR